MDSSRCMRSGGALLVVTLCGIFRPLSRGESRSLAVGLLGTAWLWAGCTKAELSQIRKAPTGIAPDEAVAIVVSRDSGIAENEIVDCLKTSLNKAHSTLRIVRPDEFRRTAFPDLAPEATPQDPEYIALLLHHPVFRERTAAFGIRYLILVEGSTTQRHSGGDIWCGGGYGGGGCLGLVWWDRESRLVATVFDFEQGRMAGEVHASASGRPWLGIVLIFPIGLPAFTETRACSELGEAVAKFLAGGNPAPVAPASAQGPRFRGTRR